MNNAILIDLNDDELTGAIKIGIARHTESVRKRYGNAHGKSFTEDGYLKHLLGACGERAVATYLELPHKVKLNSFKAPDLSTNIQVRTRSDHQYDLIVRRDDPEEEIFVLVTGSIPWFRIRGWLYGGEAKQDQFLAAHGGREQAWFVPADELHDICLLKQEYEDRTTG